jgi:thiamine-monophosphate kinase
LIRRDGAQSGDKVVVSGTLGDGAIALTSLGLESHLGKSFGLIENKQTDACRDYFEAAFYKPEPRIALASQCGTLVNSGIDISDGLLGDLGHIVRASGCGANLHTQLFPYSDAAKCCTSHENRLRAALYGGDDYELCLTVSAQNYEALQREAAISKTPVTCIGEITDGGGITCFDESGSQIPIEEQAFVHFHSDNG